MILVLLILGVGFIALAIMATWSGPPDPDDGQAAWDAYRKKKA